MGTKWQVGALALLLMAAAGCGGDDSVGPKKEEITGTWRATKVEYVSKSSPASVELIAAGATATLVLNTDNSLVYTLTKAGGSPEVTRGTWVLTTDLLTVTPEGMPWSWSWDVSLSSGTLRLAGADATYDCDNDGTPEEADWNLVLVR